MYQGKTEYSESALLESMRLLSYSIKKLEILLTGKKPVGYYESEVEHFRKYNTGRHIKRSL